MKDLQRQIFIFLVSFHLDFCIIDSFLSDYLLPLFAWGRSRLSTLQLSLKSTTEFNHEWICSDERSNTIG